MNVGETLTKVRDNYDSRHRAVKV